MLSFYFYSPAIRLDNQPPIREMSRRSSPENMGRNADRTWENDGNRAYPAIPTIIVKPITTSWLMFPFHIIFLNNIHCLFSKCTSTQKITSLCCSFFVVDFNSHLLQSVKIFYIHYLQKISEVKILDIFFGRLIFGHYFTSFPTNFRQKFQTLCWNINKQTYTYKTWIWLQKW